MNETKKLLWEADGLPHCGTQQFLLVIQREITDLQIIEWSKSLNLEWLNQDFKYISGVDGKTRILPTWVLVTHMFNHQTHHRGQLTTLLSQLGYNPGITDLPFLPWLNAIS